jgi:hypothetical protein
MSTRADFERVADDAAQHACALCGDEHWEAIWSGHTAVLVCRRCALEILPALIADAVCNPHVTDQQVCAALERITSGYWRGVALAVLRGRDRR